MNISVLTLLIVSLMTAEAAKQNFEFSTFVMGSMKRPVRTQAFNPHLHDVNDMKWNQDMQRTCLSVVQKCPCDFFLKIIDTCASFLHHEVQDANITISGVYEDTACDYYRLRCDIKTQPAHYFEEAYQFLPCNRAMQVETTYKFKLLDNSWSTQLNYSALLKEGIPQTILSEPGIVQHTGRFHENMTFWYKDVPVPSQESQTGDFHKSFHVLVQFQEIEDFQIKNSKAPEWLQVAFTEQMDECSTCWGGIGCLGNRTTGFMIIALLVSLTALLISTVWHCSAVNAAKQATATPVPAAN